MARSWSYWGFNPVAKVILGECVVVGKEFTIKSYTDGRPSAMSEKDITEKAYEKQILQTIDVWHGEELHLCKYTFSDGRVLEGYIQAEPWSSGPNTFMALRDYYTKDPIPETLWSQEEIDRF